MILSSSFLQQVLPEVERIFCDCSSEETQKEIAVAYCEDCKDNICETCYRAHLRVRLTKDHRISWFSRKKHPILNLVRMLNSLKNFILISAPRHYKNKNKGTSLQTSLTARDLWSKTDKEFHLLEQTVKTLSPSLIQDSFAKMEIFREAVKIINDKFPLDSEFEIYERKMKCSITKKKWKEAYIRYPANPDNYSKAYSHAGSPAGSSNNSSDEDSDSEYE